MAQEFAKKFYDSKKWRDCRKSYVKKRLLIDGGLCECCHLEPGYIVHHKVKLTQENITNPEISLNHDNLAYECKLCHDNEDGHWMDKQGLVKVKSLFDSNGQPVDIRKF